MSALDPSSTKAANNRETGHISRIQQSLEEKNIVECSLLTQIEDELCRIKSIPGTNGDGGESGISGAPRQLDLIQKLDEGQETMHRNNARLQDILNHIRSLV